MTFQELIEAVEESLPDDRSIRIYPTYQRGAHGRSLDVKIWDGRLGKLISHPTPQGAFEAWWDANADDTEPVARELGEIPEIDAPEEGGGS